MKLSKLPRPFFALAPLYEVTDTVFRRRLADLAPPDLFFTEFVNADGLQSPGRDKIIHSLKFSPEEKPIIAQIWGRDPRNFRKTARELVDMGFDGVDINFGCPDKTIVKNGCCSALIENRGLASQIIRAARQGAAGNIPVSVKTRLGFSEFDSDWLEFLLKHKLDMLSIHLRTVKEMSKVAAHWDLMSQIKGMRDKISPNTLLVGNGDITSRVQGEALAEKYAIEGVMIGRGVFSDPYVFAGTNQWQAMEPRDKIKLYLDHVKLFQSTWKKNEYPIVALNKFCKIYINGFDGAKDTRARLMRSRDAAELQQELKKMI